jgi:hypothetical protein
MGFCSSTTAAVVQELDSAHAPCIWPVRLASGLVHACAWRVYQLQYLQWARQHAACAYRCALQAWVPRELVTACFGPLTGSS